MIIYIGQFWTAILEFRRHFDFFFYLVFIYSNSLSLQHTFWHKYQLCSSNTRRYRQHYTLSAAILSFGRHLGFRLRHNLCPGIFLKLFILPTYPENFMLVSRSEIFWHYMTRPDYTMVPFCKIQIFIFYYRQEWPHWLLVILIIIISIITDLKPILNPFFHASMG